jgi:hypothetical protein
MLKILATTPHLQLTSPAKARKIPNHQFGGIGS